MNLGHLPFVQDEHIYVLNKNRADYFVDSGAIVVAASTSKAPYQKNDVSNFGNRINCFAHGNDVVSTGGWANLLDGPTNDSDYTKDFGDTSAAAAIIAGVALVVQNTYYTYFGFTLNSIEMRKILSEERLGMSQDSTHYANIGVMPDLRKILSNIDLLRDYLDEKNVVFSHEKVI